MDEAKSSSLSLIGRALADPIRIRILDLIAAGEVMDKETCCSIGMCVCDLQEALDLKQSKVSYHLRELKQADLVHERKQGKWNYYTINTVTLQAFCQDLSHRFHLA
ncbi:helix-turn-helix transcriptional regulator [Mechercharimyces sp. CAU 1602]|uniref:ArsR/SmtB family transcription factor n=1 Tax=Mechercharimyces sp. CAU 1602 TaxID=2973933 RepID=UPI002163963D|nr:metalloregulator ArsR/SmtB family transcription factor [Mechercharimyces sp. CAU 1602]MCS1351078.1 metalloregulator ArsR/SmtB family transcription factor [Mechercharimyces sp. CAU 1602]